MDKTQLVITNRIDSLKYNIKGKEAIIKNSKIEITKYQNEIHNITRTKLTKEEVIKGAKLVSKEMGYTINIGGNGGYDEDYEVIAEELDNLKGGQVSIYLGGSEDQNYNRTYEEYLQEMRDMINWEFNGIRPNEKGGK